MNLPTFSSRWRALSAEALGVAVLAPLLWHGPGARAQTVVESAAAAKQAFLSAKPGTVILLKNGRWQDAYLEFQARGTREKPIVLRAETPGKVILTGTSRLDMAGQWLVVDGLRFEHGALASGQNVIRFRGTTGDCTDCRLTNSTIVRYNPPDPATRYTWLSLHGNRNRVDHNRFEGQSHAGQTVVVLRKTRAADEHTIEFNHFIDRAPGSGNGFETIRIGTSADAQYESRSKVQFNLFERTNGEIEAVSVKAGRVLVHGNTFREVQGAVTLRHGNGSRISNNVFLGNDVKGTGGVRIMGEGHVIENNHMEALAVGAGMGAAISFNCGHADEHQGANEPIKNVVVVNNTLGGVAGPAVKADVGCGTVGRTVPAVDVCIMNNRFSGKMPFIHGLQGSGWVVRDNLYADANGKSWLVPEGTTTTSPFVSGAGEVIRSPAPTADRPRADRCADLGSRAFGQGASRARTDGFFGVRASLKPLSQKDVGPAWSK